MRKMQRRSSLMSKDKRDLSRCELFLYITSVSSQWKLTGIPLRAAKCVVYPTREREPVCQRGLRYWHNLLLQQSPAKAHMTQAPYLSLEARRVCGYEWQKFTQQNEKEGDDMKLQRKRERKRERQINIWPFPYSKASDKSDHLDRDYSGRSLHA